MQAPQPLQPAATTVATWVPSVRRQRNRSKRAGSHTLAAAVACGRVDLGDLGIERGDATLQHRGRLCRGREPGADALGRRLRRLARPGDEDSVYHGLHRTQLRVDLIEEAVPTDRELERRDQVVVLTGNHPGHQDHEIGGNRQFGPGGKEVVDGHR